MKLLAFRIGFTNVYLLQEGKRCMITDTGSRGHAEKIVKAITARGLKIENVSCIFLTHSHFDHAGSAAELQTITRAKVIIHHLEAGHLARGFTPIPKGTNALFRFISKMGKSPNIEKKIGSYKPLKADIIIDGEISLAPFGFDVTIMPTPGHTSGSCSLVGDRFALIGDTMFNFSGKYYPVFANDETALRESWSKLLKLDVDWFYPAHGKRIRKDKLLSEAKRIGIL
ncbi:MAG: MBL fold metallo-hydrolase [bacterium]